MGSTARVGVDGPREDFRTVIEVPEDSDLTVRLTAGVLKVQDVGGDRDIRLRAGELHIEMVGRVDEDGFVFVIPECAS